MAVVACKTQCSWSQCLHRHGGMLGLPTGSSSSGVQCRDAVHVSGMCCSSNYQHDWQLGTPTAMSPVAKQPCSQHQRPLRATDYRPACAKS